MMTEVFDKQGQKISVGQIVLFTSYKGKIPQILCTGEAKILEITNRGVVTFQHSHELKPRRVSQKTFQACAVLKGELQSELQENALKKYKRRNKQKIQLDKQQAIAAAQSEFFGGISKQEAIDIFKALAVLAQFPGATPPEPLTGCEVIWISTLKVGDSLDRQRFTVQAIYKNLSFTYTSQGDRGIQLPDSSLMNLESWDYQALLLEKQVLEKFK